jgi:LPXTG-motif cell wall-anchored protein
MRRLLAIAAAGVAGLGMALVPAAGAGAADSVVTIPADCGGPAFCFTPSTLTITDGDTVTWSNQSATSHTVYRCYPGGCSGEGGGTGTDPGFTSAGVATGGTYVHTFHGPGTYNYFCTIHGYATMHGVIVVNAAPPPTTATTVAPTTAPPSATTVAPPTTAQAGITTGPVAATTPTSLSRGQLAHTGSATGSTLALGLGALVLGLAAWGVCTRKRGVLPRL